MFLGAAAVEGAAGVAVAGGVLSGIQTVGAGSISLTVSTCSVFDRSSDIFQSTSLAMMA